MFLEIFRNSKMIIHWKLVVGDLINLDSDRAKKHLYLLCNVISM